MQTQPKLILPKTQITPASIFGSYFCLEGPVDGGGDWQAKAFELIRFKTSTFTMSVPNDYQDGHPLYQYVEKKGRHHFTKSSTWERRCREMAFDLKNAAVMCYLPCECQTEPRKNSVRPYATETYGILGECVQRLSRNSSLPIIIGAEQGFPGLERIQADLDDAIGRNFRIFSTLEQTVTAALQKISHR